MRTKIPVDSRVADIAGGLKNPVEYVRRVLAALVSYGARRDGKDYLVFVSLQSDPAAPDYSILELMDGETGGGVTLTARSGKTGKEIDCAKADAISWAQEGSSFNEVQELLGELRDAAKSQ